MNPDRWQRLEALFDAALAVAPGDRQRFIDVECGDDVTLRRELDAMLRHDGTGQIAQAIVEAAAADAFGVASEWEGRRLGAYRILRTIGQGGMGAVFLAVRDDDEYR